MPRYSVTALEKFVVRTVYDDVEAKTSEEAVELCKRGKVAYDRSEIEEGDEEWIRVVDVEEM